MVLFGQLSQTGKAFNEGYYLSFFKGGFYFAKGEEEERDLFLKEKEIYDEETPDWDTLHELYPNDFYYSEWYVEDGLDGGYNKEGVYYIKED